jgi:hypothetical protein
MLIAQRKLKVSSDRPEDMHRKATRAGKRGRLARIRRSHINVAYQLLSMTFGFLQLALLLLRELALQTRCRQREQSDRGRCKQDSKKTLESVRVRSRAASRRRHAEHCGR